LSESDAWELDPKTPAPKARERLTEPFFWDEADENSPLGNDAGHDSGAHYRKWRRGKISHDPARFLKELLRAWEVEDADWGLLDAEVLRGRLERAWYHVLTRDDVVIGLAFAQMILEGRVHADVKRKALWAVERQALDAVIAFRGWSDAAERKKRLEQMRGVLSQDWS
jgi:uncharacterized protein YfeS